MDKLELILYLLFYSTFFINVIVILANFMTEQLTNTDIFKVYRFELEQSLLVLCYVGAHITKKVAVLTSILCVLGAENWFSAPTSFAL